MCCSPLIAIDIDTEVLLMRRHKIAACPLCQRVELINVDVYSNAIASLDLVTCFFAFGVTLPFLGSPLVFTCIVFK